MDTTTTVAIEIEDLKKLGQLLFTIPFSGDVYPRWDGNPAHAVDAAMSIIPGTIDAIRRYVERSDEAAAELAQLKRDVVGLRRLLGLA